MLYLEDFLELIENLPMEVRDRFTDMRELDLQVQNSMDELTKQSAEFFQKCDNKTLLGDLRVAELNKTKSEFRKIIENSEDKIQIATQMCDTFERYIRKLNIELEKFKCELEADQAGITEDLEKKSLLLDRPPISNGVSRSRKRKHHYGLLNPSSESDYDGIEEQSLNSFGFDGQFLSRAASSGSLLFTPESSGSLMTSKRSVNRVDYDKLNKGLMTSASAASLSSSRGRKMSSVQSTPHISPDPDASPEFDWGLEPPDNDDKRYCYCNNFSYGQMIACDNPNCSIEWFHYPCVNLTSAPRGKWYCHECAASLPSIISKKKARKF